MGTHPIFESDFDCLTVYFLSRAVSRKYGKNMVQAINDKESEDSKIIESATDRPFGVFLILWHIKNYKNEIRIIDKNDPLTMHIRKDAIPDNQFEFSPDSDTELSNLENESE